MGKNKFRFKTLTVREALKKGLQPYKDFYPLKNSPSKNKKNSKPDNRTVDEMILEDSSLISWADLGKLSKNLYDTPKEALAVLVRESNYTFKGDVKLYLLCEFLERMKKDKIHKGKKFNKIIDEHLEQCCTWIDVDYNEVDIPKSEMIPGKSSSRIEKHYKKTQGVPRQQIIDRIVSKHDRLVIKQPDKFKNWLKEYSEETQELLVPNS